MAPSDSGLFLLVFATVTYYFSAKMNRLILLMGPVCAALGGVAVAAMVRWSVEELGEIFEPDFEWWHEEETPEKVGRASPKGKARAKAAPRAAKANRRQLEVTVEGPWQEVLEPLVEAYNDAVAARKVGAGFALAAVLYFGSDFYMYCEQLSQAISQPANIFKSKLPSGKEIIIDDYREAYWWLRDHTPEDARVMAWWDYGYQIAGVGNRTTIADGNTWNHEHIATLGRCLTSSEDRAHRIIRHLADYILIWTGGGGDDLAKSPHMARIANSVYRDVCPGDPTCSNFSVDRAGRPSKMMRESLLWKLHGHNQRRGAKVDPALFEEAYSSKHNMVRIFRVRNISEDSKAWAEDPANYKCDAPGSWHCQGQYPPSLAGLLEEGTAFKQLEDFNSKDANDTDAQEYQKAYHEKLANRQSK